MLSRVVFFAVAVMLASGEVSRLRGPRSQSNGIHLPQQQDYLHQQINEIPRHLSAPLSLGNPSLSPVIFEQPAPIQIAPNLQQHRHAGASLGHQLQLHSGWPSTQLGELVLRHLAYADDERLGPHQSRFRYGVNDHKSGDNKQQEEIREGDSVRGRYTLLQPDGLRRVVDYSSTGHSGFNALVHYE